MGCKFLGNRSVRLQNLLFSLHIYTLAAASWKLAHCCAIFLWCLGGEIYIINLDSFSDLDSLHLDRSQLEISTP